MSLPPQLFKDFGQYPVEREKRATSSIVHPGSINLFCLLLFVANGSGRSCEVAG